MALQKIQLRPGVFREGTEYSNQGGWYDCDKIRFRSGLPEKMKGWVKNTTTQFVGTCRSLISWSTLTGQNYIGLGTTSKYYVQTSSGGSFIDITPIRATTTLTANQMSANNGSANIYIRDATNAPSATVGDYVNIANAVTFAGIPAASINTQTGRIITAVFSVNAPTVSNPITTTNGTKTISVAWANNPLEVGNFISVVGLTGGSIGGITTAEMEGVFVVTGILTSGSSVTGFTYSVPTTNATSSATGGGNTYTIGVDDIKVAASSTATSTAVGGSTAGPPATTLSYQLSVGLNVQVTGDGWGAGPWSRNGWGESYGSLTTTQTLRLWSNDTYGEDLIINPRDNGIFYETQASIAASTVTAPVRAVNITSLPGANNCPTVSREVAVSGTSRHVLAFACNPYGETTADPMLIRWSAAEDIADWQPRLENDSGDIRMSTGSQFITQIHSKQQIVIWTDISMYALEFVGAPYTFALQQIGYGTSIIGPNAKSAVDDVVYWMGDTTFYRYGGRIEQIPCTVKDYVFSRLNYDQAEKITSGTNLALGEVMWFYVSNSSPAPNYPIDSYVTYNYLQDVWYYGSLARTAWLDFAQNGLPIATGEDRYLYNHESGYDDGSTTPASPITAYIESSGFEIGDGDSMMFVRQIYPDLTFANSTAADPLATFTISARNYPGAGVSQTDHAPVDQTNNGVSVPVGQFTQQLSLRLRGRAVAVRIESSALGVAWRFGTPRFELRSDGRR